MRNRFSLRTFLVLGTLAGLVLLLGLGSLVLSVLRVRTAVQHLNSNGIKVWHFSDVHTRPFSVSALQPLTPSQWNSVHTLGALWMIAVDGEQGSSAECLQAVQLSRETLSRFYLRNCSLTPELIAALNECSNLESIVLVDVNSGSTKCELKSFPQLKEVTVSGRLSDVDLKWLGGQAVLEEVNITSDSVTDELATTLVACKSLRKADLAEASLTGVGMMKVVNEGNLTTLKFPPVDLSQEDLAAIAASSLEWIDLHRMTLHGSLEPLLLGENTVRIRLATDHWQTLLDAGTELKRDRPLRIGLGPIDSNGELPRNPWPDAIHLEGFTKGGMYWLPKEQPSESGPTSGVLTPTDQSGERPGEAMLHPRLKTFSAEPSFSPASLDR